MEVNKIMEPYIELREILWEITNHCKQNCSYCGSKDIVNTTPIELNKLYEIVNKIAAYYPAALDITGGNPLLVPYAVHLYLTETLIDTTCKILINPFNISHLVDESPNAFDILALYPVIGISINTVEEATYFYSVIQPELDKRRMLDRITIITNFNLQNVFHIDELTDSLYSSRYAWQIQYTMYDGKHPDDIRNNKVALKYLDSKIEEIQKGGYFKAIIKADNMNDLPCVAGRYSLGILANGDVIPCLSMRSWSKELNVMGNLLEQSLGDIWHNGFANFRCRSFQCCKDNDAIQQKEKPFITELSNPEITNLLELVKEDSILDWVENPVPKFPSPNVVAYGVQPQTVFMYGVWSDAHKRKET